MLKRERRRLEGILSDLKRGQDFLMRDRTEVCIHQSVKTTTLDYTNDQGTAVLASIDKEIGSPLAMLHIGIGNLSRFLQEETT